MSRMLQPSFSVNFLKFVINNFCQRWWSFVSSQIQMTVCLKWILHPKWKFCQHLLPYFDPKSWDWTLQDLIVSCISHDLTFMTSSCKSHHCNCVDYFNGTASFAGHHKHTGCIIKWITKVLTISRTLPCLPLVGQKDPPQICTIGWANRTKNVALFCSQKNWAILVCEKHIDIHLKKKYLFNLIYNSFEGRWCILLDEVNWGKDKKNRP